MRRMNRHASISAISGLAAIVCLLAAPVSAQPLVATVGVVGDTCIDPNAQTNCTRGILYLVNGDTIQVQTTFDLWRGLENVFFQKLVVHPGGTLVYVAQSDMKSPSASRWIDVFDLRTMTRVTTYTVNGDLKAVSPDGTRLYLAATASVLVIDSATGGLAATIPADLPTDVAITRSASRIYVAQGSYQSYSIAVLDGATGALLHSIPLSGWVPTLKLTRDDAHLYALAARSAIFDIETASDTVAGVITDFGGPTSPNDLTFARDRAYVAASLQSGGISCCEYISIIDVATRTLVAKIPMVDPPNVEASVDETRVWTSVLGEPRLITIDTATNQVLGRVTVPGGPVDPVAVPTQRIAAVIIDQPSAMNTVQEPFNLSGWAVDVMGLLPGPGIDTVHVWAFPASGAAPTFVGADYGRPRPDVGALFGASFTSSGYQVTVRGLAPASYQFFAFAHSTRTGAFSIVRAVPVTIRSSAWLVIDTPRDGSSVPLQFQLAGWALDGSAAAGAGIDAVHVWAYPTAGGPPVFAGATTPGDPRPDVAAFFGAHFANAGYHVDVSGLPPGGYTMVVYGHSAVSGTFAVEQQVRVTVTAPQPLMFVDTPTRDATVGTTFLVAGWAVELNAASGTGVDLIHVWATSPSGDAIFLGAATIGIDRPDVAAWLGARYLPSGFALQASAPAGRYWLSVYVRSTTTGTFRNVQVVPVVVQ